MFIKFYNYLLNRFNLLFYNNSSLNNNKKFKINNSDNKKFKKVRSNPLIFKLYIWFSMVELIIFYSIDYIIKNII